MIGKDIFIAILLGGGAGSRLESSVPKAFVEIENQTLLEKVSSTFYSVDSVFDKIIATVPTGWEEKARSITSRFHIEIITGGRERQDSSRIAVKHGLQEYYDADFKNIYVLIHDIARCFITKELIMKSIEGVQKYGAVTLGIPSIDSLKEVDSSGQVQSSLDRSRIWMIQTPQVFRADLLLKAYNEPISSVTDDSALVEVIAPVYVVKGSTQNRKITNPEDLYSND